MRDPIANLNVETAIDDAVKMLGISIRLGRFHEWEVVDESDCALRSEARIHIEVRTDWDMPEHIRRFLLDLLRERKALPRKRGRHAQGAYRRRNTDLVTTVKMVCGRGFEPTRSPATTENESACSIVHTALRRLGVNLSEGHIGDIWSEHIRANSPN